MFKSVNFTLFDIKLKSPHKDIILIKGNEFECESIPFHGSVKLSIREDTHIKKIKLGLIGEFNIECVERSASGAALDTIVERLCVLRVDWPNLLTNEYGNIVFGNYGDVTMRYNKVEALKCPGEIAGKQLKPQFLRAHSSPNTRNTNAIQLAKSGVDGTPFKGVQSNNQSFFLPRGNYNIPFSVTLPSTVSETVEGLNCATLLYKLECTIEKGRFEKPIVKSKHIRIIRTLHPQSLNLVDVIDIDNTWTGKIQYNVKLSRKGVAIGSNIPINLKFIPMTKGISLHNIKGSLTQQFTFKISGMKIPDFEQHIAKQELIWINQSQDFNDENTTDTWNVKTYFKVPNTLKGLNQSCDFKHNLVRVKHRLRLSILLLNKEGHMSELRANLPIWIYISANAGYVIGKHYEIDSNYGYFTEIPGKEDIYFKKDKQRLQSQPTSPNESMDEGDEDEIDLDRVQLAPPLYDHHVNDPLFDSTANKTPYEQLGEANKQNDTPSSLPAITSYFDIPASKNQAKSYSTTPMDIMNKIPTYEEALDEEDDSISGSLELAPIYNDVFDNLHFSYSDLDLPTRNRHFRSNSEGGQRGTTAPTLSRRNSKSEPGNNKSPIHLSISKVLSKRK